MMMAAGNPANKSPAPQAQDTGWVTPGAGTEEGPGRPWGSGVENITAQDSSFANNGDPFYSDNTYYLVGSSFSLSVPSGATINGVEIRVRHQQSFDNGGVSVWNYINIRKNGSTLGNAKNPNQTLTLGSYTEDASGDPSDLWGLTLTPSDVNSSDFEVLTRYNFDHSDISVDVIWIKVHYTA